MPYRFLKLSYQEKIPENCFQMLKKEVMKDIEPLLKIDFSTAWFLKKIMLDYRLNNYLFLKWIDKTFSPKCVLYPASGHDVLPKLVFGKCRVIHTTLNPEKYFDELGEARKIKADNSNLPFKNSAFQAILVCGIQTEGILKWKEEFNRVLKVGGIVMIIKSFLDNTNIQAYCKSGNYTAVPVPPKLQKNGESETEFFVFKKTKNQAPRLQGVPLEG